MLSNSVFFFARGVASVDLDRPNARRHHESETNVQTAEVLQASHWMHSKAARTQGIVWKMIESRSRSWLCCLRKQMLSKFVQMPVASKAISPTLPPRRQRVICLTPQGNQATTVSERFPSQPHAKRTCFRQG